MRGELGAAVSRALGGRVDRATSVAGGDINQAWDVAFSDGRRVFVKENARAPAAMFESEARGLEWLRGKSPLVVPKVLAVSAGAPAFLALEHLGNGGPRRGFDEELGRGLAELHRAGPEAFGLDHDNFIGRLPQENAALPSWAELYRERRLGPMLTRAQKSGLVTRELRAAFDGLFGKLDQLVGPSEPPARLHGDLWGGNLHVSAEGAPCLIDPAVYGGHREMDLAMMKLFGGFGARVFAAYDEAFPLAPGHEERVALYQLYPLLVHVNLFGAGYLGAVKSALGRYL